MAKRAPISKKTRFEVFKRDKFTCQYCGAKAPEAILELDHIHPVAKGGTADIMNLVTACAGCNGGKGARVLDDMSVVERQRRQIEELEERRAQLEMMLAWRGELASLKSDTIDAICDHIAAQTGFRPNESGKSDIRKWMKTYSFEEVLVAAEEAFDTYGKYAEDAMTVDSWNAAFKKIGAVAGMLKRCEGRPYMRQLLYIQGIIRNRTGERYYNCLAKLEEAHLKRCPIDNLTAFAKTVKSSKQVEAELDRYIAHMDAEA